MLIEKTEPMAMLRVNPKDMLPQTVSILDAPVADIDMKGLIAAFDTVLQPAKKGEEGRYVCFRDAHGLVHGLDDDELMEAHHKAMLVVPDGMPLVWIGRMRGAVAIQRVAGMDVLPEMAQVGVSRNWRHVFVGGAPGVAAKLASRLEAINPGMIVAGIECPPFRAQSTEEIDAMIARINDMKPDLVWIGLGSPKQDLWMKDYAHRIKGAICLGVGGAFDTHAGNVRRAPLWVQKAGLEWAYRIAQEPRRLSPFRVSCWLWPVRNGAASSICALNCASPCPWALPAPHRT
jgi:N-acetylglucosaminyldiphosphoundecaprenol N-acetyl-beta-D-mannosaminyltransferase